MNSTRFLVLATLTILLGLARAQQAQAGGEGPQDPLVPNRLMVGLADGVTIEQFIATINADFPGLNAAVVDTMPSGNAYLVSHGPASEVALETALRDTYQPNLLRWGDLLYNSEAPEGKTGSVFVDNIYDLSAYENQYAVTTLNVPAAQKRSTGTGAVVAILDTGIDASHPQLAGRIAPGGFNALDNSANTADSGDKFDNDGDGSTDEMTGHGTYVAGLVALVAPEAKLLPITVLDSDGVGNNWTVVKGLQHAIDKGVEVVNMSLGSTYDSEGLFKTVEDARSKGIVVVAAAGNFNMNDNREYPAMFDTEIDEGGDEWVLFGVAATDEDDVKASFSNYNKRLFISACGDSVINAQGQPDITSSMVSTTPGGNYHVWEGTSMAVPLVSGAVAMIRAQHPEWPASLDTFFEIRDALADTAVNIYPQNPEMASDQELGVGRIDIGAAVERGPSAPTPGDLDNNGAVTVTDLLKVISDWGLVHTSADINGDGTVNVDDMLIVIQNWG